MALENIVGETQVSRRGFLAASLGTILVSALPAFGQDQQATRNNTPAGNVPATNSVSFDDLRTQGDRYLESRQYPQAIDTYTRALGVQGHEHDPALLNQRGMARAYAHDHQGAIDDLNHSLRFRSIDPVVRKNLALIQYRIGRDQRNQELATTAIHNLYIAIELAYAQSMAQTSFMGDLEAAQRSARTDFPTLDTAETSRGMTRDERYGFAQALTRSNYPGALFLYRRVAAENANDEIGRNALRRIPMLEGLIRREGLAEISMR